MDSVCTFPLRHWKLSEFSGRHDYLLKCEFKFEFKFRKRSDRAKLSQKHNRISQWWWKVVKIENWFDLVHFEWFGCIIIIGDSPNQYRIDFSKCNEHNTQEPRTAEAKLDRIKTHNTFFNDTKATRWQNMQISKLLKSNRILRLRTISIANMCMCREEYWDDCGIDLKNKNSHFLNRN